MNTTTTGVSLVQAAPLRRVSSHTRNSIKTDGKHVLSSSCENKMTMSREMYIIDGGKN